MEKVSTVGIDISKRVFQLHGSSAEGGPVFRKKLTRGGFLPFLEDLLPCLVATGPRRPPLGPSGHRHGT